MRWLLAPIVPEKVREEFLGKIASVEIDGLGFTVKIEDVRRRYGHTDVAVRPIAGYGTKWVDSERLTNLRET